MRRALIQPYVNPTLGSVNAGTGAASTVPEYTPGQIWQADSGIYVYGQANGVVAEGYACYYVEGTWDFAPVTTAISGSTNTPIGVCVVAGGLVDNQWGWFWRGGIGGTEYVYLTASISANTQLTTVTPGTAGQVTTGGDPIHNLFNNAASGGSGGLTLCRSTALLETNTTITN